MLSTARLVAIVLAILALLGLFGYLVISKSYLAADLADAQNNVTALTIANKQFALAAQESKEREDAANKALISAEAAANKLSAQVAEIEAQKPTNKDDCKAAEALLNKYVVRHK